MRILWLSWKSILHPDAGGAEIVGHENAKALVQAGHNVTWISLSPYNWQSLLLSFPRTRESIPTVTTKDGVQYPYIGNRKLMYTGLFHLFIFINYITNWRHHYDLVIDEIHGPPLLTPLYVRKPILVIIHEVAGDIWQKTIPQPLSSMMQYVIEPLMFKAYKKERFVIGAETTREDLIHIGISGEQIKHIPYGVEIPETVKNNSYPKESTPTLIFLSALRPMKGFDRVYNAFKKLHTQIPQLKLWVVGDDSTEHASQMKTLIKRDFPDTSPIQFFGKVSQEKKFELLQRAHILVHGSYKEGWGLVVIEANAVGTPAVVFDAAGLRNSIKQGENGYLSKNEQEFIKYTTLLLSDQNQLKRLSDQSIIWSKQFSWSKATHAFLSMINQIIQDSRPKQ